MEGLLCAPPSTFHSISRGGDGAARTPTGRVKASKVPPLVESSPLTPSIIREQLRRWHRELLEAGQDWDDFITVDLRDSIDLAEPSLTCVCGCNKAFEPRVTVRLTCLPSRKGHQ
jgi:hypothetical protein